MDSDISNHPPAGSEFSAAPNAAECKVRDYFAGSLIRVRPEERLIRREPGYRASALRADMRTIDRHDILREWEFKLCADHLALGQLATYVALAREEFNFRPVRGVLAAFEFTDEAVRANEVMNLCFELVTIPEWMRAAGGVPRRAPSPAGLRLAPIPVFPPINREA